MTCWTQNGEWSRLQAPQFLYKVPIPEDMRNSFLATKIYSACGEAKNRIGLNFEWKLPETCILPKFSPSEMCRVMRGRNLMFLGDSLSIHHFETTIQAMGNGRPLWTNTLSANNPVVSHTFEFCKNHGEIPFSIHFTKENWAVRGYVPLKDYVEPGSEALRWRTSSAFLQQLHDTAGLVLIVNRGAHFFPDRVVTEEFTDFLRFLSADLPQALLIFRSSNMAHPNCQQYSEPVASATFEPVDEPLNPDWHWKDFPSQSQRLIQPLINGWQDPKPVFLDIFHSIHGRPDQHPSKEDCLHYCVPGPIDLWVQLVFGVLDKIEQVGGKLE